MEDSKTATVDELRELTAPSSVEEDQAMVNKKFGERFKSMNIRGSKNVSGMSNNPISSRRRVNGAGTGK